MSPEFGFLHQILENSCRILENSHRKLEILAGIWKFWPESGNLSVNSGFSGFRGGKPKPTRQNRFLVVKIRRRPAGEVRSTGFGSVPVGFSGGSGYRINLDSPTSRDCFPKKGGLKVIDFETDGHLKKVCGPCHKSLGGKNPNILI